MSEIIASGIIPASTLREYINVFTPLVSEGKVHFNDDGISVRVVDPANVAMVYPGYLRTTAFESYESPGSVTIGMDFKRLIEKLKPANRDDLVHLAVDMETRKLKIEYGNATQNMALIDPESIRQEPDDPGLEFPNHVTVTGEDLSDAVEIMDLASDHTVIQADPDERTMSFYSQGDTDDADVSFGDEDLIEGKVTEATESVFSLEYLKDVVSPIPDEAEVTVTFGEEHPAWFEWEHEGVDIAVMCAPRIQTR